MNRGRTFFLLALASIVESACIYDWNVGAEDGTGGQGSTTTVDASSSTQSGGAGGSGGGVSCGVLLESYDAALRAAKACVQTDPGVCAAAFTDLCGCTTYIAREGTPEAMALVLARDAVDAACIPECTTCPSVPVIGACAPDLVHGGVACSP